MMIRFASKINIIRDESAFETLVKQAPGPEVVFPWSARTRVHSTTQAFTRGIYDCNAGGLTAPGQAMLFHFRTSDHWWDDDGNVRPKKEFKETERYKSKAENCHCVYPQAYRSALRRDHAALLIKSPETRGFLSGGIQYFSVSRNLKRMLKDLYTTFKLPFSVLWGGDRPKALHYSCPQDTWTMLVHMYDEDEIQKCENPATSPVRRLMRLFTEIAIAPGDEVALFGTPILQKELKDAGLLKRKDKTS